MVELFNEVVYIFLILFKKPLLKIFVKRIRLKTSFFSESLKRTIYDLNYQLFHNFSRTYATAIRIDGDLSS
jgi:hypothetical protein